METKVNTPDAVVAGPDDRMNGVDTEAQELADFIIKYVERTNSSFRQLSMDAGLGESTVSLFMRGDRKPGLEFCKAIAPVMGVSVEQVLRMAGHLKPASPLEREQKELLDIVRAVPREHIRTALAMLHGLAGVSGRPIASAPADRQFDLAQHLTIQTSAEEKTMLESIYRAHGIEPPEGNTVVVTPELVSLLIDELQRFQRLIKALHDATYANASPAEKDALDRLADEKRGDRVRD